MYKSIGLGSFGGVLEDVFELLNCKRTKKLVNCRDFHWFCVSAHFNLIIDDLLPGGVRFILPIAESIQTAHASQTARSDSLLAVLQFKNFLVRVLIDSSS